VDDGFASFSNFGIGADLDHVIAAPGVDIFSTFRFGGYETISGTSMASPHVVGVIALVYSAKPSLIGDVSATERLLERTAKRYTSSECSSNGTFPNNLYGWGLPDAARAAKP